MCGRVLRDSITFALALLAAAGLGLARPASGQFASGVDLVEVYASVTDSSGAPVTGLSRTDFEVLEDGRPQALEAFAEGDFPLSVAVAVDRSFSMAGERLATARTAARAFLGQLRPEDEAAVIAIGSRVETLAPLSTDRRAAGRVLGELDAFGTTGLYDAVIDAIGLTEGARGRRALVLLSDGSDRYSEASAGSALDRARRSNVIVYPVAIGRTPTPVFAELAALTGGRSFQLRQPRELEPALRAIAAELRHQYLLGYAPPRGGGAGWRSIQVTVRRPGVRVRARDGYVAQGGR
jgi:Ca-activated chloride channel family protein